MPAKLCSFTPKVRQKIRYFFIVIAIGLLPVVLYAQENYRVSYFAKEPFSHNSLKTTFSSKLELENFLHSIPAKMIEEGFPAFSVDSIIWNNQAVHVYVYPGPYISSLVLYADTVLNWEDSKPAEKYKYNFRHINAWHTLKEEMLRNFENSGYPFAKVGLKNAFINQDTIVATLDIDKGFPYVVDSVQNMGSLKLNKKFLHQYLGIVEGQPFNKAQLLKTDSLLNRLEYGTVVMPTAINMLYTGATVQVFVNKRPSNLVNIIAGFMPAGSSKGKMLFTYDADIRLVNNFGRGEELQVRAFQLQESSPRINLFFQQPYILGSKWNVGLLFDLFKQQENFLQVRAALNADIKINAYQKIGFQLQRENSSVLLGAIDTLAIKQYKRLPDVIDAKNNMAGVVYTFENLDNKVNPTKGLNFIGSVVSGLRTIQKNNTITGLYENGYDFNVLYDSVPLKSMRIVGKLAASKYLKAGKWGVWKLALQGGSIISSSLFKNELFMLGGFNSIRGFNEESIYARSYSFATLEYRQIINDRSYLFVFGDGGVANTKIFHKGSVISLLGGGLGIQYNSGGGLLKLMLAVGKRSDIPFTSSGATKIHIGYVNYF